MTVPIIVNGKFLGVAGVSVPLTSLQKMVEDISIYETGYASLISNQGIYVGDDEASVLGKRLDQTGRFDAALGQEVLHAIQNGQPRTKRWRGAGGRSRHRNGPGHTAEAALVEEMAASARSLQQQAQALVDTVAIFKY